MLPTDDITLHGEKFKSISLTLGTERDPLFPLLFNIVLKTLGGAIEQEKKTERQWTIRPSLYSDDMYTLKIPKCLSENFKKW